jgi:putative transposase
MKGGKIIANRTRLQIVLTKQEREELESWLRRHTIAQNLALRARIIIMASQKSTISHIARNLDIQRKTVRKWIMRYQKHTLQGLYDKERTGRPKVFSPSCRTGIDQNSL